MRSVVLSENHIVHVTDSFNLEDDQLWNNFYREKTNYRTVFTCFLGYAAIKMSIGLRVNDKQVRHTYCKWSDVKLLLSKCTDKGKIEFFKYGFNGTIFLKRRSK